MFNSCEGCFAIKFYQSVNQRRHEGVNMKKSFVKPLVPFTVAISLCVAAFIGVPAGSVSIFPPDGNDDKLDIKAEEPLEPSGKSGIGEEPTVEPQDDINRDVVLWE